VAAAARAQGVGGWHLSLSHDGGLCVAIVIAESATSQVPRATANPGAASDVSEA
jgi:hypothetical protein